MSKLLTNLIAKAEKNGEATINSKQYGRDKLDEPIEKYYISIQNNVLLLRHWGTTTLILNLNNKQIIEYYGESVTDKDSLNFITSYYNIPVRFRYLPSTDQFIMIEEGAN